MSQINLKRESKKHDFVILSESAIFCMLVVGQIGLEN